MIIQVLILLLVGAQAQTSTPPVYTLPSHFQTGTVIVTQSSYFDSVTPSAPFINSTFPGLFTRYYASTPSLIIALQSISNSVMFYDSGTYEGIYYSATIAAVSSISYEISLVTPQVAGSQFYTSLGLTYLAIDLAGIQSLWPNTLYLASTQFMSTGTGYSTTITIPGYTSIATPLIFVSFSSVIQVYQPASCATSPKLYQMKFSFTLAASLSVSINYGVSCTGSLQTGYALDFIIIDQTTLQDNSNMVFYWYFTSSTITVANTYSIPNSAYNPLIFAAPRQFQQTPNFFNINITVQSSSSLYVSYDTSNAYTSFNYLTIYERYCTNVSYPFFRITSGACYATCIDGQYPNYAAMTCVSCDDIRCKQCNQTSNGTAVNGSCLSCYTANNQTLVNGSCVAMPGFYDVSLTTPVSIPCPTACQTCTTLTSSPVCITCNEPTYVNVSSTSTCTACSLVISNCKYCYNQTFCSVCKVGYHIENATVCRLTCAMSNCWICSAVNISVCLTCLEEGYHAINGVCTPVCGDGIIVGWEECDDGTPSGFDGCDNCKITSGFTCVSNSTLRTTILTTSYCTYTATPSISLEFIKKVPGVNQVTIGLTLSSYQSFLWKIVSIPNILSITGANLMLVSQSYSSSRRLQGSQILTGDSQILTDTNQIHSDRLLYTTPPPNSLGLTLTFSYTQSIQNIPVTLWFNFPYYSSIFMLSSTPGNSLPVQLISDDNQQMLAYDSVQYADYTVVKALSIICGYGALLCIILGIFTKGKPVIVEMVGVMQLAYITMMTISPLKPAAVGLLPLQMSTGFNSIVSTPPWQDISSPLQLRGVMFYSSLFSNFNISSMLVILPCLIGGISLLLTRLPIGVLKRQPHKGRILSLITYTLQQLLLYSVIINSYLLPAAFVVHILYGSAMMGLVIGALCILVTVGVVVVLTRGNNKEGFGQFNSYVQYKGYYALLVAGRWVIAIGVVVMRSLSFCAVLPIIVLILSLVLTIVMSPQSTLKHKVLSVGMLLISVLVQISFLLMRVLSSASSSSLTYRLPLSVGILLMLALGIGMVMMGRQIYKGCTKKSTEEEGKTKAKGEAVGDNEEEQMKKCRQQFVTSNPMNANPLNYASQRSDNRMKRQEGEGWGQDPDQLSNNEVPMQIAMGNAQNTNGANMNQPQNEYNSKKSAYRSVSSQYRSINNQNAMHLKLLQDSPQQIMPGRLQDMNQEQAFNYRRMMKREKDIQMRKKKKESKGNGKGKGKGNTSFQPIKSDYRYTSKDYYLDNQYDRI